MNRVLISMLVALASTVAFAQQPQELVYLKNGSIIRGVIVEQIPGETLKIQMSDGSVFVYNMSDVERISKEPFTPATATGNGQSVNFTPDASALQKESVVYAGRNKEGMLSLDFGAGVTPNEWLDEAASAFDSAMKNTVPEQEWPCFSMNKNISFAFHAGVQYTQYFKADSPWFWEVGAFAENDNMSFSGFYQGAQYVRLSAYLWNICASGSVGMQTSPNIQGLHFYWKAGAGAGYLFLGGLKVVGMGPAAGISYDLDSIGYGDYRQIGSINFRPFAEIGLGGDSFFRMGLRYSPVLTVNGGLFMHCISVSFTIPII